MSCGGPAGLAARGIVLLALAASSGCAGYTATTSATRSIYSVRVVKNAAEVRDCRPLGRVDSRDEAKGCGLTVQPTPEECLRYQVRRAGGDTLVIDGPVGDAYDCSGGGASAEAPTATPPPTPAPSTAPAPSPRATPTPPSAPIVARPPPAATPTAPAAPRPTPEEKRARVVSDRGAARGCVYVGDLDPKAACPGATGPTGSAAEDCLSRRGAEAGADTVVWDGGVAQLFSCKAAP
jgi:hypothetical protein